MKFQTKAQQENYTSLVSLAENTGFDIEPDETAARAILRASKTKKDGQVGIVVTAFARGTTVIKGHGVTANGRTVHLKNAEAVRNFIKSHWV